MLIRYLLILALIAQPLVTAASWACRCSDGTAFASVASGAATCCSVASGDSCACRCDAAADSCCGEREPGGDAAHLAVCPTLFDQGCPGCECSFRPALPNAPIPERTRQVSTNHWTLPPPALTLAPRSFVAFEQIEARRSFPASWLARCGTSIDRRVALSSWTT